MLISRKTHCFNCKGFNVFRSTETRPGGWAKAIYRCPDCESYSATILTIGHDTGKRNPRLKDLGIGTITYYRS